MLTVKPVYKLLNVSDDLKKPVVPQEGTVKTPNPENNWLQTPLLLNQSG